MIFYFPLVIATSFAAITVAGYPLASRAERILTTAATAFAAYACTIIYL